MARIESASPEPELEDAVAAPYRSVSVFIDLISQKESGDDLPVEDWRWYPYVVFDHGDRNTDTEYVHKSEIEFETFEDAFTWVFHALALAHLEIPFELSDNTSSATWRCRLPRLCSPDQLTVQRLFISMWAMTDIEIEGIAEPVSLGWGAYAGLTKHTGDDIFLHSEPISGNTMPDAFALVLRILESALPSAPVSGASLPARTLWRVSDYGASLSLDTERFQRRSISTIFSNEDDIEEHLVNNPVQLYDGLVIIGQQLNLGDRWADIVALDTTGNLVVIEVKYKSPNREAIGQVIEYAAFLWAMANEDLDRHLTSHGMASSLMTDKSFRDLYVRRHGHIPASGIPVRMALVGTEADEHAIRSINYLRSSGLRLDFFKITALSKDDSAFLLVERNPPPVLPKRWYAPNGLKGKDRTKWILDEASYLDIGQVYHRIYEMIEECVPYAVWKPREDSDSLGLNRALIYKQLDGKQSPGECLTIRVNGQSIDRVWILLFDKIIELAPRKTRAFLKQIPHWRAGTPGKSEGCAFELSIDDWEEHRDGLHELLTYIGRRWTEKIGR